jgi:hypothetical protein
MTFPAAKRHRRALSDARTELVERATRAVIESLEVRRLLSSIGGSPTAAVGTPYTLDLNTAGIVSPTSIDVKWGDGYTSTPGRLRHLRFPHLFLPRPIHAQRNRIGCNHAAPAGLRARPFLWPERRPRRDRRP